MTTAHNIIYVGDWSRDWNTEVHVAHGLVELGHRVQRLQEQAVNWSALAALVRSHGGSMVWWTHSKPGNKAQQAAALADLRNAGIPTISYHLDRWWGLARREHIATTDPFFRTDLVVTADGGHADRWQGVGVRHKWLPPGVHGPEVGRGTPRPELEADVAFVGQHPYSHPEWRAERDALIRFLRDRYGDRFRLWPDGGPQVRGPALNDLYASVKVVVGDSCLAGGRGHYWSDRIPETLGRGGFLIHPATEGLDAWYEHGWHLLTFDGGDLAQLGQAIDGALDEPEMRQMVTKQALELVAGRDTYRHRAARVLEMAAEAPVRRGWLDGRAGIVSVRHGSARARFDLRAGTSDSVAVREVWQQDAYRLRPEHVRGAPVIDIGAHVGAFSILAAALGAPLVHAVEPVPSNRAQLVANVALNRLEARVLSHDRAVNDDADDVVLVTDGSGSHLAGTGDDAGRQVVVVPAWSLSGLFDLLAIDRASLLKIDCEGCEYASLAGLAAVLGRVDRLVMEFHGPAMPHLGHLDPGCLGPLVVVLAEAGVLEVVGRASTGGMIYWSRHQ